MRRDFPQGDPQIVHHDKPAGKITHIQIVGPADYALRMVAQTAPKRLSRKPLVEKPALSPSLRICLPHVDRSLQNNFVADRKSFVSRKRTPIVGAYTPAPAKAFFDSPIDSSATGFSAERARSMLSAKLILSRGL